MLCSDHFGIGKCIPITSNPVIWPQASTWPVPWYGPFGPLKPKKKLKKKKKTKIFIKVAGDLTGLDVKAKKKNGLLKNLSGKQKQQRAVHKKKEHLD